MIFGVTQLWAKMINHNTWTTQRVQNKAKQSKAKQNKTKQNKTKQNKQKHIHSFIIWLVFCFRYKLLLNEVLKYMKPTHPDYNNITQALVVGNDIDHMIACTLYMHLYCTCICDDSCNSMNSGSCGDSHQRCCAWSTKSVHILTLKSTFHVQVRLVCNQSIWFLLISRDTIRVLQAQFVSNPHFIQPSRIFIRQGSHDHTTLFLLVASSVSPWFY